MTGPHGLDEVNLERLVGTNELAHYRATTIHAIGELFPHAKRYMDLDPELRDLTGAKVPRLHMGWTRAEQQLAKDLRTACTQLADAIAVPDSRLMPVADPLQPGAGHEAGTCVMGRDERAPCDENGRVRALSNVWVADAAALPTATDRHPTLTILAHALRAADNLSSYLSRPSGAVKSTSRC
ncbi:MAG: GMC family oxidoreductase [Polyangiaceae bacterium]